MQTECIASLGNLVGGLQHDDIEIARQGCEGIGAFALESGTPDAHIHAERARAPRDFLCNTAKTKQAQRSAVKPTRLGKLSFIPTSCSKGRHIVGNTSIERQE